MISEDTQSAVTHDASLNLMTTVQYADSSNESAIHVVGKVGINEGCIQLVVGVSDQVENLIFGTQEIKRATVEALRKHDV